MKDIEVKDLFADIAASREAELVTSPQTAIVEKDNNDQASIEKEAYDSLSLEEKKIVEDLVAGIDINNTAQLTFYGVTAQRHMSEFADGVLKGYRTKDNGEIGKLISELVVGINSYTADSEPKRGLAKWFSNSKKELEIMKAKYKDLESNIDTIKGSLEEKLTLLNSDITLMEKLYNKNFVFYKELTIYIIAGKRKIAELKNEVLPEMIKKVEASGDLFYSQQLDDLKNKIARLEKRIFDLELTKQISFQTAPQIRMIQNNDMILVEKIQSSLLNTIPLWKNQMIIALGISHSREAAAIQRDITNLTNQLLTRNAEQLKMASVEVARENERGIVDIETLKKTNETIISSFSEIMEIQAKGRSARVAAEEELLVLERELKEKILESCSNFELNGSDDNTPSGNNLEDGKGFTYKLR